MALRDQIPFLQSLVSEGGAQIISFPSTPTTTPSTEGDEGSNGKFTIATKITPQQDFFSQILAGALILLVLLLLAFLALKLFSRPPQPAKPLSPVERIEKIDELLMHGKISERNWEILHERYFKQLKDKDGEQVRSIARKKKKKS